MGSVKIDVYQTDSAGNVDWGNYTTAVNPWALSAGPSLRNPIVYSKTTSGLAGATTDTENVELFKGYYRIVITATPSVAANSIATYISSVITVAGGGATVSTPVALAAPSKAPSITLQDTTGAALANYTVYFYESTNKILIGTATSSALGVASVGAPSGTTGVLAKIYNGATYLGVYAFSDINTTSAATLKQFTVQGQVQPNSGTLDATDPLTVYALTNSGLGRWADNSAVASVAATPGTGVYSLTLFGGTTAALNYKLGASSVKGYPDVTKTSIALNNAALTGQNIAVAPGGLILGKIQTEGKVDIAGVTVYVFGTAADGVIEQAVSSVVTNATGDYSIEVPYGTYFLLVNGAVTDGISISAGAVTYQKNLTQFAMTGQVSKNLGSTTAGANAASVLIGFQTATTSNLGVYTINVMEGKNWICMAPSAVNDPTYGAACTLNVQVDATTVAAARL
jgi:hypothetical protein